MVKELLLFEALNCGPCGYHGDGPLVVHAGVAKHAAEILLIWSNVVSYNCADAWVREELKKIYGKPSTPRP